MAETQWVISSTKHKLHVRRSGNKSLCGQSIDRVKTAQMGSEALAALPRCKFCSRNVRP